MMTRGPESRDLLLEIGMAEVPARFLPGMLEQLGARLEAALAEARLAYAACETSGAPRRVAVTVRGLAVRQPDRQLEVRGPAAKAAFDGEGNPTAAALGFAKGQGVTVEGLFRRELTPGNEYVFANKVEVGQDTVALLPHLLAGVLTSMQFARNMRWGDYSFEFVRPIRWLLCLYGNMPVRVTLPGLPAGLAEPPGTSRGHRFLAPGSVHVETPAGYRDSLRTAGVIVDPVERRDLITGGALRAAAPAGGVPVLDPALVDELVWLAEHPVAVLGAFDPEYLGLPEPVLITVMQHHQRFIPVRAKEDGRLLPAFVGVRDGGRDHLETVRAGYETVLRARLADARFFFQEDRRSPLASRGPELEGLVYHERLGTVRQRTERLQALVAAVGALLGLDRAEQAAADQAALLAKCDLVTQMVRELPELQGVMGCEYARLDGQPEQVARAIAEQYLPAGEGTSPPATRAGLALAVSDKLDALVGHFYAGVRPTGSHDPYGMRRAASGVVSALIAQGTDLDLRAAVDAARRGYEGSAAGAAAGAGQGEQSPGSRLAAAAGNTLELLQMRIAAALSDGGAAHDEIEAVAASTGLGIDAVRLAMAARAIGEAREEEWFRRLSAAAVRAAGLGGKATDDGQASVDESLFESDVEHALWQAYQAAAAAAEPHLTKRSYIGYWRELLPLAGPVDGFFDGVLVMAPDAAVRRNRLALCRNVHKLLAAAGDLSRVVWLKETPAGH